MKLYKTSCGIRLEETTFFKRLVEACGDLSSEVPTVLVPNFVNKRLLLEILVVSEIPRLPLIQTPEEAVAHASGIPWSDKPWIQEWILESLFSEKTTDGVFRGILRSTRHLLDSLLQDMIDPKSLPPGLIPDIAKSYLERSIPGLENAHPNLRLRNAAKTGFKPWKSQMFNQTLFVCGFRTPPALKQFFLTAMIWEAVHPHVLIYEDTEPTEHGQKWPSANLIHSPSCEAEALSVAEELIKASDKDQTWDDFLVVVPNETYGTCVAKIFDQRGIPHRFTSTDKLSDTPICQMLFHFLGLAKTSFDHDHLLRFLRSGLVKTWTLETDPIVLKPVLIEDLAARLNITKSWHSWESAWQKTRTHLQNDLESVSQGLIDSFEIHIKILTDLFTLVEKLRRCTTAPLFTAALEEILAKTNCLHKPSETGLDDFLETLTGFKVDFPRVIPKQASFTTLVNAFQLMVETTPVQRRPPNTTGVTLVDKSHAPMPTKSQIYIMGLSEGNWPNWTPNTLETDTFETHCQRDRHLFWDLFLGAKPPPTLSFCTTETDATGLPSRWIAEAKKNTPFLTIKSASDQDSLRLLLDETLPEASSSANPGLITTIPLLQTRLASKSYSVTELETFQKCPRHYFFKNVLGELPPPKALDEGSADQWGLFMHDLLCKTMKKHPPKEAFLDVLHQTAHDLFSEWDTGHFLWAIRKDLLFGTESQPGLLAKIAQDQSPLPPMTPTAFEQFFQIQIHQGLMRFHGKIDMVLIDTDQQTLAILDYKKGRAPGPSDIENFQSLQIPLYLLAAQALWPGFQATTGGYHLIPLYEKPQKKMVLITKDARKNLSIGRQRPFNMPLDFFDKFKAHCLALKQTLEQGLFGTNAYPTLPRHPKRKMMCNTCSYKGICRDPERFL